MGPAHHHLKRINDTLGHSVGDELLRACGRILRSHRRSGDLVGRLGGDEFSLTLPHIDKAEAENWATAFLHRLENEHGIQASPLPAIGASIGIVAFDDLPDADASVLQVCADLAMYEAKHSGGGRVAHYTPELEPSAEGLEGGAGPPRLTWSARIKAALRDDTFELYAQPILDLDTDRVSQHELLLRLMLPDREVVLPGSFIYTAERFGLMLELDRWVLAHAFAHAAEHRGETVSVNLSADSICNGQLTSFVTSELGRTGADPRNLIFEVTETAAISNIAGAKRTLNDLIDLGARVALDDFGAGFGSFHHLKQLPLQFVKIDGEFICGLAASRRDRILVRSMVDLAHGLGQLVVAEHVEDKATLELVRHLGADLAQGNFIGPAEPLGRPASPALAR